MGRKDVLTKALAIIGTVFIWFPILSPIVFLVIAYISERIPRFDFLMPVELFVVALLGGGMLFWAALREQARRGIIGWGLATAVFMLIGGQALAVASGLATGEAEPTGWIWALVLASLGAYSLALVVICIGGVLLLRDLFRYPGKTPNSV